VSWDSFFSSEVGASAALAGLVFVGISINLQRILALPTIANRALQSLLILLGVLGVSSLVLVPGQSGTLLGGEVTGLALVLWGALNVLEWRSWKKVEAAYARTQFNHSVEIQLPCLFTVLGGVLLIAGNSWALYGLVISTLASFLIALLEAWIITVEILR
jgi:hypothetical protein